jgi:hypothetical protein
VVEQLSRKYKALSSNPGTTKTKTKTKKLGYCNINDVVCSKICLFLKTGHCSLNSVGLGWCGGEEMVLGARLLGLDPYLSYLSFRDFEQIV